MTTLDKTTLSKHSEHKENPPFSLQFDRLIAILSTLFVVGIYFDGWAHNNVPDLIETFFTPYHALLYGGFLIVAVVLAVNHYRHVSQGYAWTNALPRGYMLALAGVVIFGFAGIGDMVWHETFGFEEDIEALMSPTHLMLALGAALMVTSPLRAGWYNSDVARRVSWNQFFPAILSMTLLLSLLTFFTQYSHMADSTFLVETPDTGFEVYSYSLSAIYNILTPILLAVGAILFLMHRWQLPFGTITFMTFFNYMLMFVMNQGDSFGTAVTALAALIAGIVGDLLYHYLSPRVESPNNLRLFAFLLPFTMSSAYLVSLILTKGIWWAIHMWAGVPFVVGMLGICLSFLFSPIALPMLSKPNNR